MPWLKRYPENCPTYVNPRECDDMNDMMDYYFDIYTE